MTRQYAFVLGYTETGARLLRDPSGRWRALICVILKLFMTMADSRTVLPEFDNPPVIEVALSVQFKALQSLRTPHCGLLWERAFRNDGFTRIEEHGTLAPAFEDFDAQKMPRVGIALQAFDDVAPPVRIWFLNEAGTQLIQIQPDRLVVNWRRGNTTEPYPRYETIRERLQSALSSLVELVNSEHLGEIVPTQCEATYVNHIAAGEGWSAHGEIDRVVTNWKNEYSDSFLARPEDVAFAVRYRMPSGGGPPIGRLYVNLESAIRSTDKRRIFVLTLTARGEPISTETTGVFDFLDLGHEWIVQGFTSLTTADMHTIWRRTR